MDSSCRPGCSKDSDKDMRRRYDWNFEKPFERPFKPEFADVVNKVYQNNLLMRTIIGNLVNMKDRTSLELASQRFLFLSRTSPWNFSSGASHLKLVFTSLNDHLSIILGDVLIKVPALTLESRREVKNSQDKKFQNPKLMNALRGMAARFSKEITSITIGGVDEYFSNLGVRNYQLIVTADFLDFLSHGLPLIRAVTFRECGFDSGAVDYFCSPDCTFHQSLTELTLDSIWLDPGTSEENFANIVTPSVRKLKVHYLLVNRVGIAITEQVQRMPRPLDVIECSTADYYEITVTDILTMWNGLARSCHRFMLNISRSKAMTTIVYDCFYRIPFYENLVSLRLNNKSLPGRQEVLFHLLRDSYKLANLETLVIDCFRYPSFFTDLANAIPCLDKLKMLGISGCPNPMSLDDVDRLFETVPRSLEVLEIYCSRAFSSDHLEALAQRVQLTHLVLYDVPSISSLRLSQILAKMNTLEEFETNVPLNVRIAKTLASMPRLHNANFRCNAPAPKNMTAYLEQFFEKVSYLSDSNDLRRSTVSIRGRRINAVTSPHYEKLLCRDERKSEPRRVQRPKEFKKRGSSCFAQWS